MSSARNHAKRSHRSEHAKAVTLNRSTIRAQRNKYQRPRRVGLFHHLFHHLAHLLSSKKPQGAET